MKRLTSQVVVRGSETNVQKNNNAAAAAVAR